MRGRFLGRVPSCTFLPACAAERSTISGLTKPGLSAIAAHHPCILDTAPFNKLLSWLSRYIFSPPSITLQVSSCRFCDTRHKNIFSAYSHKILCGCILFNLISRRCYFYVLIYVLEPQPVLTRIETTTWRFHG
jgi:hypothetical protein